MKKLYIISIFLCKICSCYCQDSLKNSITILPLSYFDRTYSVSYYRKILNDVEFSINARIRFPKTPEGNQILFWLVQDPYWFYNRYTIGTGLVFHNRHNFFFEPMIQYNYGYFDKTNLQISGLDDEVHEVDEVLSRRYNSIGTIYLTGFDGGTKIFKVKFYTGIGIHYKIYNEKIYSKYVEANIRTETYDPPLINNYLKFRASFHLGAEIGMNF